MTDMKSPNRRIIKRTVIGLIVVVLLPVWYVVAWLIVSKAAGQGIVSFNTATLIRPMFLPVIRYCDRPRPGARYLSELWWRTNPLHILHKAPGTFDQPTNALWRDTGIVFKPTNAHVLCPNDLGEVQKETAIPSNEILLPPSGIDPWQSRPKKNAAAPAGEV